MFLNRRSQKSSNIQRKTPVLESVSNKVEGLQFSCEYCEIFKNSFFHKTPPLAASEKYRNFKGQHQRRRCNRFISLIIMLKSGSHLIESPLMIKDAFYFIFKALFCSQGIQVFIEAFWSCGKSGLIRKIRLISKLMTSQPCEQTIATYIFPNISRSKNNQTMKLGKLIGYSKRNIFLQKRCRK